MIWQQERRETHRQLITKKEVANQLNITKVFNKCYVQNNKHTKLDHTRTKHINDINIQKKPKKNTKREAP